MHIFDGFEFIVGIKGNRYRKLNKCKEITIKLLNRKRYAFERQTEFAVLFGMNLDGVVSCIYPCERSNVFEFFCVSFADTR